MHKLFSTLKSSTTPFVRLIEHGTSAVIQLNRPEALNALNLEMFQQCHYLLRTLEHEKDVIIMKGTGKVFCSGGDVKQIASLSIFDVKTGYRNSHRTIDLISKYKKPFVALVDGLAMGGAAVYGVQAKYRVATERTLFAMPETAIGYFNDAGATTFLHKLENNFGVYLGMTGARVKGYDMKKIKLATHFIESSKLDELEKLLIECKTHDEVSKTLDLFSSDSSVETELDSILPRIGKCFGGETVEQIYENLRADGSEWAMKTINTLNKMSPTSLKVTHKAINLGKIYSMQESLQMEFRLVVHHLISSDLQEGVRALLIEKDFKPKWNPATIHEVTDEMVDRFFKPMPDGDELTFDFDVVKDDPARSKL